MVILHRDSKLFLLFVGATVPDQFIWGIFVPRDPLKTP